MTYFVVYERGARVTVFADYRSAAEAVYRWATEGWPDDFFLIVIEQ